MLFELSKKRQAKKTARYFMKRGALVNDTLGFSGNFVCRLSAWENKEPSFVITVETGNLYQIYLYSSVFTGYCLKCEDELVSMLDYFSEMNPNISFRAQVFEEGERLGVEIFAYFCKYYDKKRRYRVDENDYYACADEMNTVLKRVYKELLPFISVSQASSDEQSQSLENSL